MINRDKSKVKYKIVDYIKDLSSLFKIARSSVLVIIFMMIVQLGFSLVFPEILRIIFDVAVTERNINLLIRLIILIGFGLLFSISAGFIQDYTLAKVTVKVIGNYRKRIFLKLQNLATENFYYYSPGDLLSRFSNDTVAVESVIGRGVPVLIFNFLLAFSSLVLMFVVEWHLALIVSLGLPTLFIGPRVFGSKVTHLSLRKKRIEARILEDVKATIDGERSIKVSGLQKWIFKRFSKNSAALRLASTGLNIYSFLIGRLSLLSVLFLLLVIIGFGSYFSIKGIITTGVLLAFLGLLFNIEAASRGIAGALPIVTVAYGGMQRLQDLLSLKSEIESSGVRVDLPPGGVEVQVKSFNFSYTGSSQVLKNINFIIDPGKMTAIVGRSGSGKSTLADFLLKIRHPNRGHIFFSGNDINDIKLDSFRAQVSGVTTVDKLFKGSIRENIVAVNSDLSRAMLNAEKAAKYAGVGNIIANLPDGYNTLIDDSKMPISDGQRQSVALARVLARQPRVLILDEATLAMDPSTELEVISNLKRQNTNLTIIYLSHRLEICKQADSVIVMDNGFVVQSGTHRQLLTEDGFYSALWRKQSGFKVNSDGNHVLINSDHLKIIPLMKTLNKTHLELIAACLTSKSFLKNDTIIQQGEIGTRFYIIARGQVDVSISHHSRNENRHIGRLDTGDYFGEISLVQHRPTTASVVAATQCSCLILSREDFDGLLERVPDLKRSLTEIIKKRLDQLYDSVISL